MPKNVVLNNFEKGQIDILSKEGNLKISNWQIPLNKASIEINN